MKKNMPLILKSVGFALIVQIIATVLAFVSLDFNDQNKMVALIILAVIMVCLIPVYFTVKGKTKRPWFYLIVTSASYIIMAIVSYVILRTALNSVEASVFFKVNAEIYIFIIEAVVIIQLAAIAVLDTVFILCMSIANFVKKHKPLVIAFFVGALASLLMVSIVSVISDLNSFNNNIYTILPPQINYIKDGRTVEKHESSLGTTFTVPLTMTVDNYFGKVDKSEYIRITVNDTADICIYRNDGKSVIVEYNPRGFGFTQRYIARESFEYYMQEIYNQTGDEGFNVYPKE